MPNVVLNALALQGATADLRRFQDALLVADGDAWGLSCSPQPTTHTVGNVTTTNRAGTAWDAGWTSTSPTSAVLSFSSAWEPPQRTLDGIGALACAHGVAVLYSAAADAYLGAGVPSIWAGEGLQLQEVPEHLPKFEALLGSAHRPAVRHSMVLHLERLGHALDRAA
jgi:hypothetical protein